VRSSDIELMTNFLLTSSFCDLPTVLSEILKTGDMIMCYLVRSVAYVREEGWYVEKRWDWSRKSETDLIHFQYNPTPISHAVTWD
jgi:hypothetical protein